MMGAPALLVLGEARKSWRMAFALVTQALVCWLVLDSAMTMAGAGSVPMGAALIEGANWRAEDA